MKKTGWILFLILIEIFLTIVLQWDSSFPLNLNNKILLIFLIPIILMGIFGIISLIFLIFNKERAAKFYDGFLAKNKIFLSVYLLNISFLMFCSLFIFVISDIEKPEVYSRFQISIINFVQPEMISMVRPYAILGFVLFWELLIILFSFRDELKNKSSFWIGLSFLLAGNYFLRHTLENAGKYLEPYYYKVWSEKANYVFSNYQWWQFLLPIKEFDGYWFFGNILTHFMSNLISISGVWYLNQAILIVVAFFISWKVFHSYTFSYILAICLGFGTHFYNAYQYSSIASLYLLQTLYILLLYFSYEFIRRERKNVGYLIGLLPMLILTAVFYEGWLDFFAAIWLMSIVLIIYFKIKNQGQYIRRLLIVFTIFNIVAAIYIYLKFTYVGFMHSSGESAVVFSYSRGYFWRAVEDMISNYFTQLYIALTNFLPPAFITSNALYHYSEFLQPQRRLIYDHYVFFWRYAAGAIVSLFFVALVKVVKRVFKEPAFSSIFPLMLFMIMVFVNSPTHTIIQFRAMKSMPVLGYYTQQGVLGVSLCIAFLLNWFERKTTNKKVVLLIILMVILLILFSSIRRPNYLWQMMKTVGLEQQGPFPNPYYTILKMVREIIPGLLK